MCPSRPSMTLRSVERNPAALVPSPYSSVLRPLTTRLNPVCSLFRRQQGGRPADDCRSDVESTWSTSWYVLDEDVVVPGPPEDRPRRRRCLLGSIYARDTGVGVVRRNYLENSASQRIPNPREGRPAVLRLLGSLRGKTASGDEGHSAPSL